MLRELMPHIDYPGVDCFCAVCSDKRAADRHAVVEAAANIASIEADRREIMANTDPEFWKWKPVE